MCCVYSETSIFCCFGRFPKSLNLFYQKYRHDLIIQYSFITERHFTKRILINFFPNMYNFPLVLREHVGPSSRIITSKNQVTRVWLIDYLGVRKNHSLHHCSSINIIPGPTFRMFQSWHTHFQQYRQKNFFNGASSSNMFINTIFLSNKSAVTSWVSAVNRTLASVCNDRLKFANSSITSQTLWNDAIWKNSTPSFEFHLLAPRLTAPAFDIYL